MANAARGMCRPRDPFPLPGVELPARPSRLRSARGRARYRRRLRVAEAANSTTAALNRLYRPRPGQPAVLAEEGSRASDIRRHIVRCCAAYAEACGADGEVEAEVGGYDAAADDGPVELRADLLSMPDRGGTFRIRDYVGDGLAAVLEAAEPALEDPLVANLASLATRSCQMVATGEYAPVVARLMRAEMAELGTGDGQAPVLGLFGVWKKVGLVLRLIVDGKPANVFFLVPEMEHTGGDALALIQVKPGHVLEVAKADLRDYFHACSTPAPLRGYFRLQPLRAADLRACGVSVPA